MSPRPRLRIIQLCVLLLCGAALATYARDTHLRLSAALQPGLSLVHVVVAVLAGILACGLIIPPSLVRLVPGVIEDDAPDDWRVDRFQLVSAVSLIAAGGAMLVLGRLADPLGDLYRGALARFHWTTLTLQGLDVVCVAAYIVVPVGLMGLAMHCDLRRAFALGSAPGPPVAAVLGGTAIALGVVVWCGPMVPGTWLVSAGVCLLIAALLGSALSASQVTEWYTVAAPACAGGGTARLYAAMIWAVALTTVYIMLVWRIQSAVAIWQVSAGCCGAVALGVLSSRFIPNTAHLHRRIGGLCVVAGGAAIVAAIILARLPLAEGAAWWWGTLVGVVVLLVPWLGGATIGILAQAIADRSARPRPRTLCAVGAGCAVTQFLLMPELFVFWRPFDWLVLTTLAWFVTGGLVLTLDPAFVMGRRWPTVGALMVGVAAAAWLLPGQTAAWGDVWTQVARATTARAVFVTHNFEAAQLLGELPMAGLGEIVDDHAERECSVGAVVRDLRMENRRLAAVALFVDEGITGQLDSLVHRTLVAEVGRRLRPDGVFIVGVQGSGAGEEDWRRHLASVFPHCERLSCSGGLCLVARPRGPQGPR